jgi:hypothetical protein
MNEVKDRVTYSDSKFVDGSPTDVENLHHRQRAENAMKSTTNESMS